MIVLPQQFEEILNKDTGNYKGAVFSTCHKFDQIFSENRLYFFEEYTDHGIRHINSVLDACANLITPDTYKLLTEKDISILVLSVFLHDLGMHLQPLTFKKMVTGGYDDVLNTDFGDQKWSVLWENYLFEAKKFNDQQRINIFGDVNVKVAVPDLSNPDSLTGVHRKLIGEFIRRHHPRIAYEVAFKGLAANDETQIDFCADFDKDHKLLAGLLARSHGMNIRDTFSILEKHFARVWRRPLEIHVVYLMAVLRLADYFQIDKTRVLKASFLTRQFQTLYSFTEHQKHLQTTYVQPSDDDPEVIYITAKPKDSTYFLSLQKLFRDIQNEVDHSWAVLGEVYGLKSYNEQPRLTYRRVRSNIDDKKIFESTICYVPERISFTVDKEVPKLLVGPLYDYEPSFGVRELLQNAVDACWEREFYENGKGNAYKGAITIKIEPLGEEYVFSITDNGKGMTLDEIKNYFLNVGGSFRKSARWRHDHIDEKGHSNINKSGRFGIGVLAAYLLGAEIEVKTKSIFTSFGYSFNTTLDQEQIEITKSTELNNGTIIIIKISKQLTSKLGDYRYGRTDMTRRFDQWYVLPTPLVTYQVPMFSFDKNEEDDHIILSLDNVFWDEIIDEDYGRILWSYNSKFIGTIICNGFVIPSHYELKDDSLVAPAIVMFDKDAKLPLNLSRTSVLQYLSFNDALEEQIIKDVIAAVLVHEVDNVFIAKNFKHERFEISHPAFYGNINWAENDFVLNYPLNLIFSKTGFYFNHRIVYGKLEGLNYLLILKHGEEKSVCNKLKLKYLLEKSDVDLIQVVCLRETHEGAFEDIFRDFLGRYDKDILGCTNVFYLEFFAEDEVEITLERDVEKEFVREKARDVTLLYYKYTNPLPSDDLFGKVLFNLLGDDLLIPYAIEDRKKKFPKAFKELEPYMRKYLKDK